MKSLPKEYYQQLEEIQAVDFVVYELVLYLDTHPNDSQAIQQYNQYAQYSKQLKTQFEALFGPLQFGTAVKNKQEWEWSTQPWPWQV
ncbi:spore coat protein CotJB [Jeotgalibacillus sp. S-D1]|uniref:spore coat protein CotJB n=1 Tax=Jeotgalibacillus sp. S-D1 TaxID=2552189 RepID=UPI0010592B2C|nr:spore coat protein CotJB [Jeotgalibacillus sp. S-D1]TDL31540.1 spore coat protein CotJB [Jeotgalibacillus sp. S-D1]